MSNLNAAEAAKKPDFQCALYRAMVPFWDIVNDVRQGTLHMREMGKTYLPKHPLESNKAYQNRLQRTTFYNAYDHTLKGLVGMILRKNAVFGKDVPNQIKGDDNGKGGWIENIDMQGTHFDVFIRELLLDAFEGHSFLLVDMPPKVESGSNPTGVATLDDERRAGMRPFWIRYRAKDAINWRTEVIAGQTKLVQITFQEVSCEPYGLFGEQEIVRYRVLRPGSWELWKRVVNSKGQPDVEQEKEGTTSLDEIPLSIIYGSKLGNYWSRPPLIDLAHLNIGHWQLTSDYRHILHYANVPILWRSGYQPNQLGAEGIGPNRIMDVGVNGQVGWAEHQGKAIGAARTEIIDIEQRMSVLGLSLLARKGDVEVTATEKIIDNAEQSSSLGVIARSLQDGIERALGLTAKFAKIATGGGSVTVNTDFHGLTVDPQKLQVYSNMVGAGQLSVETLWQMLQKYGELPEDFVVEIELKRLQGMAENAVAGDDELTKARDKSKDPAEPAAGENNEDEDEAEY